MSTVGISTASLSHAYPPCNNNRFLNSLFLFFPSVCSLRSTHLSSYRKLIFAFICLSFVAGRTHSSYAAQTLSCSSEEKTPKAMKGNQIKVPAKRLPGSSTKLNPALAVSVDFVLRDFKKNKEIILVDVRARGKFEKFRIPGSINIPIYTLKTKGFLKNKKLVLVNEGYHQHQLAEECGRLKTLGFASVSILAGGLNYWKRKGGPLEGSAFEQKELKKISPKIFLTQKNYADWIVIDVSDPVQQEVRQWIPPAISIPFPDDREKLLSKLKTEAASHAHNPFLSILILNKNGKHYERMEKHLSGMGNIFYLAGGLGGYQKFLKQQPLLLQSRDNLTKTFKKGMGCS